MLVCQPKQTLVLFDSDLKKKKYWPNTSSLWAFQQVGEIVTQPRAPVERHVLRICQSLVAKLQSCSCRGRRALGVLKMRILTGSLAHLGSAPVLMRDSPPFTLFHFAWLQLVPLSCWWRVRKWNYWLAKDRIRGAQFLRLNFWKTDYIDQND